MNLFHGSKFYLAISNGIHGDMSFKRDNIFTILQRIHQNGSSPFKLRRHGLPQIKPNPYNQH